MSKSLTEYADWLDERDLIWPKPPAIDPPKVTPYVKPLAGIRAVTWFPYGVLLRITDGELLHDHPQELRMQIALDKTIREFNMWHSMTRKPGEPWKQMYDKYRKDVEQLRMVSTGRLGDTPEIDSRDIWGAVIRRLQAKEYRWETSIYGDEEDYAEKIAYFFHASLQGVEASPNSVRTLNALNEAGIVQTLLGDGQCFTLAQMLRAFRGQGTLTPPGDLFAFDCLTLSFQEGVRTPSPTLYRRAVSRFQEAGIRAAEILHVGCRLADDVAVAKRFGMRTALYAADKTALRVTKEEINDAETRPDRLITDLNQLRDILQTG